MPQAVTSTNWPRLPPFSIWEGSHPDSYAAAVRNIQRRFFKCKGFKKYSQAAGDNLNTLLIFDCPLWKKYRKHGRITFAEETGHGETAG